MSLGPIAGLAGKVKALVALFPADNLTKVNRLDATILSRLSDATGAKQTELVAMKATVDLNLDAKISQVKLLPKSVVLTSGTSWTPPAKMVGTLVLVSMIGGGGKGETGGAGKGGGGGAYLQRILFETSGAAVTYAIGAGGTSSASAGSTTTFGSLSCTGGKGGTQAATTITGGARGGAAIGGVGQDTMPESASGSFGGNGGAYVAANHLGGGGGLIFDSASTVRAAQGNGSGYGAGSGGHATAPTNGASGAILLEWNETP